MEDNSLYKFIITTQLRDIIFRQHMKNLEATNCCICILQTILLIGSLIACAFLQSYQIIISALVVLFNIALLIMMTILTYARDKAYEQAKKGILNIEEQIDLMNTTEISDDDFIRDLIQKAKEEGETKDETT